MGATAENVADRYKVTREAQDEFAVESTNRTIRSQKEGLFKNEIVAVAVPQKKGDPVLVTEDEGRVLSVFPGSERLRYTIPFAAPQDTIDCLARMADQQPGAIAVFGDDGEKFGTWPQTLR